MWMQILDMVLGVTLISGIFFLMLNIREIMEACADLIEQLLVWLTKDKR